VSESVAKGKLAELATSLERYERTAAFLPVYLYAARIEDGRIIPEFYSPVVERITGYPREEFLRDPWFWLKLVLPQDRPRIDEALKDDFRREHEISEYRIVRKDGAVRWVRDQLRVSFDEKGEPNGYYGTVEDITERKEMEAQLAASEQRYRDLVETADDIIYQQNEEGLITSINAAGERFFGFPREQMIGQRWSQLLARGAARMQPSMRMLREQIQQTGMARAIVTFPARDNKEEAILEFRLSLMRAGERAVGLCGVGRDITILEQQRAQLADAFLQLESAQAQLVQNERMIAMAQLAGALMHEINNPLSVILGYAQLLPQMGKLPEPVIERLSKIEEMSLRISEIIKQLDGLEDSIVEFGGAKIINLHRQSKSEPGDKRE
jgi:PAS domain S-box-containing protein